MSEGKDVDVVSEEEEEEDNDGGEEKKKKKVSITMQLLCGVESHAMPRSERLDTYSSLLRVESTNSMQDCRVLLYFEDIYFLN